MKIKRIQSGRDRYRYLLVAESLTSVPFVLRGGFARAGEKTFGRKKEVDMEFFDRAVLLALFALLAGCFYLALKAVYRYYHWRRSLLRIERREWVRTVQSLRSGEEAY
jgi:hypothetical protein